MTLNEKWFGVAKTAHILADCFDKHVLATYQATDTNIISIKRETVTNWNPEKKKNYTDKIRNNKYYYPVPYFDTEGNTIYKGLWPLTELNSAFNKKSTLVRARGY